jgi:hypothetical protein
VVGATLQRFAGVEAGLESYKWSVTIHEMDESENIQFTVTYYDARWFLKLDEVTSSPPKLNSMKRIGLRGFPQYKDTASV